MAASPRGPVDYRPPNRFSRVLRSGALFWSCFAVAVLLALWLMSRLT